MPLVHDATRRLSTDVRFALITTLNIAKARYTYTSNNCSGIAWRCVSRYVNYTSIATSIDYVKKMKREKKREKRWDTFDRAERSHDVTTVSKRNERLPWLQSYFRGHVTNSYKIPTRSDVIAWRKLARLSSEILMRRNVQMALISDIAAHDRKTVVTLTISLTAAWEQRIS